MAGRPKSQEEKRQDNVKAQNKWMERAVEMYRQQQDTPDELEGEEKFTLKEICNYWEERCLQEDGEVIMLNRTTLTRRYNGIMIRLIERDGLMCDVRLWFTDWG